MAFPESWYLAYQMAFLSIHISPAPSKMKRVGGIELHPGASLGQYVECCMPECHVTMIARRFPSSADRHCSQHCAPARRPAPAFSLADQRAPERWERQQIKIKR